MKVIVLGGDGFCGWPTSLHLSGEGHEVTIVDNLSRRAIDNELGTSSLTPIASIQDRIAAWHRLSSRNIAFEFMDVAGEYERLVQLIGDWKPDAIVHFAEQRAAPYSMKSARHKRYTVENNVTATHNVLSALVDCAQDVHLVHLGTMGVYGYGTAGTALPEGYLKVLVQSDSGELLEKEILYPVNPGSVYHMTKTLDQLMFQYYAKNDNLRITDLHQGIVWGTNIDATMSDPALINRFDYDGDYGTVLNRFLMQAAIDYPLTVHGTGGQTRAFIHIRDTARCIQLAIENPPESGQKVRVFNQMTETHRVRDLARMIAARTGVPIQYVSNPRKEAPENELLVSNRCFLELGLQPTTLALGLMEEVSDIAKRFAERCDRARIPCTSTWTKEQQAATTVMTEETPEEAAAALNLVGEGVA